MEFDSGLMFLKKRILFWVLWFVLKWILILKKIFLFWVLGFVSIRNRLAAEYK